MERVRIDKWLWAARFFKSRSLASDAVNGGLAQLNGARVKPSKDVAAGDELEITIGQTRRVVIVRGVSERRGPAKEAGSSMRRRPPASRRASWRPSSDGCSRRRPAPIWACARPSATAGAWTTPAAGGASGSSRFEKAH